MPIFRIGELAILQHASYFEEWEGALAVVVSELTDRLSRDMHSMHYENRLGYIVRPLVEGAMEVKCRPYQLRKLDEPGMEETEREQSDLEMHEQIEN